MAIPSTNAGFLAHPLIPTQATTAGQGSGSPESLEQKVDRLRRELEGASAFLELMIRIQGSEDLKFACYTLANELQRQLGCHRVALGLCVRGKGHCQVKAISGFAQFDRQSETVRATESALDECMLRDSLTVWPPSEESQRQGTLAHKRLCSDTGSQWAVSSPLRNSQGDPVGALVVLGRDQCSDPSKSIHLISSAAPYIGSALHLLKRARRGRILRLLRGFLPAVGTARRKLLGAGLLALFGLLAVPAPYKVRVDFELQPVTRRYVAAPYDGTLEQTLVEPGDLVSEGQVLARMDGRELRWQLAGLVAEHTRAGKQRDVSLAGKNVGAAQIARLEMQRINLKQRLLENREENLEIKSPISGIVISGDLKKAEGVPLTVGQTLFEIGPLDRMIAELAVPEAEVAYVQVGHEVRLKLLSFPRKMFSGKIARIHPRSQIRDHANAFIAELTLESTDGMLRPGMNGKANILGSRHAIGWNLFHRPLEYLRMRFGW